MKKAQRYKLDNAGHMYSSVMTSKNRPRFLFSAVLREEIDPETLGHALEMTMERFPYFNVQLKRGFFWYLLEKSSAKTVLQENFHCDFPKTRPQDPLLRVGYCSRTISVEMTHVLCDGFGALTFLKTLLVQYFLLRGIDVPYSDGALDIREEPCAEEHEDCYGRFKRKFLTLEPREGKAFRPENLSAGSETAHAVTGVVSTEQVLAKARSYGASVTEYLAAVLVQSLYMLEREHAPNAQQPVNLSISANLRKYYPTKTQRNFSGYSFIGIAQKLVARGDEFTFEEILREVHSQCQSKLSKESLHELIRKNLGLEHNLFIQIMPLFIKRRVFPLVYFLGTQGASMNFTNMGAVCLPEAIRDKVERFDTIGGNLQYIKMECGVISYLSELSVSFSRAIEQPLVEMRFFELLSSQGIPVRMEMH